LEVQLEEVRQRIKEEETIEECINESQEMSLTNAPKDQLTTNQRDPSPEKGGYQSI
jgi:hypothetical protein